MSPRAAVELAVKVAMSSFVTATRSSLTATLSRARRGTERLGPVSIRIGSWLPSTLTDRAAEKLGEIDDVLRDPAAGETAAR